MTIYHQDDHVTLYHGDALTVLETMDSESVDCIVTSPPYFGLRDYGVDGQIGSETSPAEFVETLRAVFAEARRVLADDGTLWLNLGDSYAGSGKGRNADGTASAKSGKQATNRGSVAGRLEKDRSGLPPKNLMGIPWRVAFALQDDGWTLRNDIIWRKPNAMPEPVTDRLSSKYEHVFMFSKSRRYWFDLDSIREPAVTATKGPRRSGLPLNEKGKNPGDVWTISTKPFSEAHFATFPPELPERCIQAGCKTGGTVLDPFSGSGTTGMAATKHGRKYVGIDLNHEYLDLSLRTRLQQPGPDQLPNH